MDNYEKNQGTNETRSLIFGLSCSKPKFAYYFYALKNE